MQKSIVTAIVLFFSILVMMPLHAHAYETGYVDTSGTLNVRDSANADAPVIGALSNRQTIEYLEVSEGWGQITYNGRAGYVSLDFITASGVSEVDEEETVTEANTEPVPEPAPEASLQGVQRVVLDPGHGGRDPGAIVGDVMEKELALDIAERAANYLSSAGYDVSLTRTGDTYVGLEDRAAFANRQSADVFISIHANASFEVQANGIETFYMHGSSQSKELARTLQQMAVSEVLMRDRGIRGSAFRVLTNTQMPAALVEFGFMTNSGDASLQQTDLMRDQSARSILRAVDAYSQ
ncbi:N-acetylmuramoyl-L-alanine amidase [Geomicrobium sp. JCM 19037]|uniref:N-acetylmuramoyl-L-alanine amidase n=1 Tax=Geomicrobium sp. JCM 19037 TaxID=1460634 RepID=UPI00045F2FC5|nr:N-acetylmuramoyl-L-alanine amidase [Geomicrobium sp. JCM 19037]GAK05073.1 N-acetylmuramoyl-L-alanine amidase [Geomicrobium sp. JCM 19037]